MLRQKKRWALLTSELRQIKKQKNKEKIDWEELMNKSRYL